MGRTADTKLPFNILRYAEDKDATLAKFIKACHLDEHVTRPITVLIRPSDKVLKKVMDKAKADDADPEALRYVFKGFAVPGEVRQSHAYVNYNGELFTIYEDGKNLYLHTTFVSKNEDITKGIAAKVVVRTKKQQSVLEIADELPKGGKPKDQPKETVAKPKKGAGFKSRKELYDCACTELGAENVAPLLAAHLRKTDTAAYDAYLSLATGDPHVDAVLMIEPNSKLGHHMIGSTTLNNWNVYDAGDVEEAQAMWDEELDTSNVDESFFENHTRFSVAYKKRRKSRKYGEERSSMLRSINEMYEDAANNNRFMDGKFMAKEAYNNLKYRFGTDMSSYLKWRDLVHGSYVMMHENMNEGEWNHFLESLPSDDDDYDAFMSYDADRPVDFAENGFVLSMRYGTEGVVAVDVDDQLVGPPEYAEHFLDVHQLKPKRRRSKGKRKEEVEEKVEDLV